MTPQQINWLSEEQFKKYKDKVCSLSRLFRVPDEKWVLKPLVLTEGQKDIFFAIVTCFKNRVIAITPTRYWKSFIVAAAIITRISANPNEKWVIVAPSEPKASIIMKYIQDRKSVV